LAQGRLSPLLALEVAPFGRATADRHGASRIDPADERRKSVLGAPRIYGEMLKLGFEVAQSSVAKYMVKRRKPPGQGWLTFLRNHRRSCRKQPVPDIARSGRKPNAARLAPDRFVDLVLVANCQGAGRFSGDKNCIAHLSAGATILGLHLSPKPDPPKPKLWQFLFDLSAQAVLFAFARSLSPTGEHPQPVAPASHQKDFAALHRYQL
jgi:hypothetical protein